MMMESLQSLGRWRDHLSALSNGERGSTSHPTMLIYHSETYIVFSYSNKLNKINLMNICKKNIDNLLNNIK